MAATHRKTDEVLASAREDLQAQLDVVREDIARLAAEELALTHAVSSLDGGNPATTSAGTVSKRAASSRPTKSQGTKSSTRKASSRRRRRPRGASKSTADRVSELRELLADGPKSRTDLAAALKVSPARVQQLLAELGSSVSSEAHPGMRRGKLWSLTGSGGGAGAARGTPAGKRSSARGASARARAARK